MALDDGVSRERVIVEATRQALLEDIRRARGRIVAGMLLMLLGSGIATGGWQLSPGLVTLLVWGGVGLTLIPFGLAVVARAAYTISVSRRRLRELDERTALPVARVRSG